jgi:hypothetical protein
VESVDGTEEGVVDRGAVRVVGEEALEMASEAPKPAISWWVRAGSTVPVADRWCPGAVVCSAAGEGSARSACGNANWSAVRVTAAAASPEAHRTDRMGIEEILWA